MPGLGTAGLPGGTGEIDGVSGAGGFSARFITGGIEGLGANGSAVFAAGRSGGFISVTGFSGSVLLIITGAKADGGSYIFSKSAKSGLKTLSFTALAMDVAI